MEGTAPALTVKVAAKHAVVGRLPVHREWTTPLRRAIQHSASTLASTINGVRDSLLEVFLALEAVRRPRHGFHSFPINLVTAGHALAESPVSNAAKC
jgi:hypothetical protein